MKKEREKIWIVNFMSILAILGVFAIGSLLLINMGIHVYKNIVLSNEENFRLRTSLSFVVTKIRQCDEAGKVSVEEKDGTSVLVLEEEYDTTYRTMLYYYNGELKELFQEKELTADLKDGITVTEIEGFQVKQISDRMLELTVNGNDGASECLVISLKSIQ